MWADNKVEIIRKMRGQVVPEKSREGKNRYIVIIAWAQLCEFVLGNVCHIKKVLFQYNNYYISFQGMILICTLLQKIIDFK